MGTNRGGRAVVIGGGMSGLFAARVLSDYVDEVVVLDRDPPPTSDPRGGVPQGYHLHGILPGGIDALCEWFPGFDERFVQAGGLPAVMGRDMRFYLPGGLSYSAIAVQRKPTDLARVFASSRPFLEQRVRAEVAALPNMSFRYDTIVDTPLLDGTRVVGVATRDGDQISADLVLDASGRHPVTVRWLEQLGYGPVPEDHIDCDLHYVSTFVEPTDFDAFDGVLLAVMPTGVGAAGWRLGYVAKQEGGRWIVGISGRYDDVPPTHWDAFLAYCRELEQPEWSALVESTRPLSRLMHYRLPRAVRHHYERLDHFPEGLLPIGDAVCFFNPIYGQGMSSAAGQCRALAKTLEQRARGLGLHQLAPAFLPAAAEWVRGPWVASAMADLSHPSCTGDQPVDELAEFELLNRLPERFATDPDADRIMGAVYWLQTPLSSVKVFA